MKSMRSKTVVISGAGSGIGQALALRCAKDNANLALIDKNPDTLDQTLKLLPGSVKASVYVIDVADNEQVVAAALQIKRTFSTIDVLVNNAGVSASGTIFDVKFSTLEWALSINLWGAMYMTKAFLPFLIERPEASVVNVSSVYGLIGVPGQIAYCTGKFALRGFTEALRMDCYGTPIKVTMVFPGGIKTNIVRNSRTDYSLTESEYRKKAEHFESTLLTSPQVAAEKIYRGILRGSPRVLIGKDSRQIDFLARFNPSHYDSVIIKAFRKLLK
ncbi:MAG TPA: SDR family oxidoreductase [Chitinispirillaceae bacterium]|nr:SDR family oxidoreductase [Chitinispirillaceae bacterium]